MSGLFDYSNERMKNMEYCLIEKWHSGCSLPPDSKAVAVNPNASYQLDKAGINYVTFGDYFSSGEIRGNTDSYLDSIVLWVKEFDLFIMKLFPDAENFKVGLPSLYFFDIKYMVDHIILSSRVLNRFIEITKPSKIWFVPQIYGEDKIGPKEYFQFGESSFLRLIRLICRERKISFEQLNVEERSSISSISEYKNTSWEEIIKKVAYGFLRNLKTVYIRYSPLIFYPKTSSRIKGNIFITRETFYTSGFYRDCHRAGFHFFIKNNNDIVELTLLPKKHKIKDDKTKPSYFTHGINLDSAINELMRSSIMKWINNECGVDVSSVFYLRFKNYLSKVFPETINCIKEYVQFYNKYKIDFVVCPILSTVEDFAAVAAAKASTSTKSVCLFHGVDAFEHKSRYFREFCNFDYFFVSTFGEVENIRRLATLFYDKSIKVNEYDYFRGPISRKYRNKIGRHYSKTNKPVVLYIPICRKERFSLAIERGPSLQWDYLKWHKALIKYFSSRKDFHFIWKALLDISDRGDSIADILRDTPVSNITFSTGTLGKWFCKADRALCDIPSTAFYECIFSGLPVLAMYNPNDQKLHEDAYVNYGSSLKPYSSIEEGINIIEQFLNSKPEKYIVSLPENNVSIPDILLKEE